MLQLILIILVSVIAIESSFTPWQSSINETDTQTDTTIDTETNINPSARGPPNKRPL